MHFFTSIATNYIPKARILAKSVKRYCKDSKFTLVLSDVLPENFDLSKEPFDELWYIEDLEIPVENLNLWIFKHSIIELCTAVKGPAALKLINTSKYDKIIYLDPDIVIFDDLDELSKTLDKYCIVLTPHMTIPNTNNQDIINNEICSLQHGIFNLGFIALKRSEIAKNFALWWRDILVNFCYDNIPQGLFTDQRWCDFVPAFFDNVFIERSCSYNVSSWNLSTRKLSIINNKYYANNKPIHFYHFSGFDSGAHESTLELYDRTKNAKILIDWYKKELQDNEQQIYKNLRSKYETYSNGVEITNNQRIVFRERVDLQKYFSNTNPFVVNEIDYCYYKWYLFQYPLEYQLIDAKDKKIYELELKIKLVKKYLFPLFLVWKLYKRYKYLNEENKDRSTKNMKRIISAIKTNHIIISVSHSDYLNIQAGTEKYIMEQQKMINKINATYFHIFPSDKQNKFGLNIDGQYLGDYTVELIKDTLLKASKINKNIHSFHIHHFLNININALMTILDTENSKRYFYVHDYYILCKQINFLQNGLTFCAYPPIASEKCKKCSFGENREQHFLKCKEILNNYNFKFIVPSKVVQDILTKYYTIEKENIEIVPHLALSGKYKKKSINKKIRIAFIGTPIEHKGIVYFEEIVRRNWHKIEYEFYSFGNYNKISHVKAIDVRIGENNSMLTKLRKYNIDIAFLCSICPETYSYSYYECYAAGCFIITHRYSGNIAYMTAINNNGIIINSIDEIISLFENSDHIIRLLNEHLKREFPLELVANNYIVNKIAKDINESKFT